MYFMLKTTQNKEFQVSCSWSLLNSGYYDENDDDHPLRHEMLESTALCIPDTNNPLFIPIANKIKLEYKGDVIDKEYEPSSGLFKISEILMIVKDIIEKRYNEKYSHGEYIFEDLYFMGLSHISSGLYRIECEIAGNNLNSLNINELMNMMYNIGEEEQDDI